MGDVDVLDGESDTWTSLPGLLTPRCEHALVSVGDTLYAIGGCAYLGAVDGTDSYSFVATRSVERYDVDRRRWEAAPPLRHARSGLAAASVKVSTAESGSHSVTAANVLLTLM